MNIPEQLNNFIHLELVQINDVLISIEAKLLNIKNNRYMVKFTEKSQILCNNDYQFFLKGMIFDHKECILSASYAVPVDVFRYPQETQNHIATLPVSYVSMTKTGTLLKLAYFEKDNEWNLSTNGAYNAYNSTWKDSELSFGHRFNFKFNNYDILDKSYVYIFILTDDDELYHSTSLSLKTLIEHPINIGVNQFPIHEGNDTDLYENNYTNIVETPYTYRYMYSERLTSTLINLVIKEQNLYLPEKYNSQKEKFHTNYLFLKSKLFELYKSKFISKVPVNIGLITRSYLNNLHNIYKTQLRPQHKKVNMEVIDIFTRNHTERDIFCLLNENIYK